MYFGKGGVKEYLGSLLGNYGETVMLAYGGGSMLEAGEYTMKRFAALYGMTYSGMATSKNEAEKLSKTI